MLLCRLRVVGRFEAKPKGDVVSLKRQDSRGLLIRGNSIRDVRKENYIGDEDGHIAIYRLSADPEIAMRDGEPIREMFFATSVYCSPIFANGTLYITELNKIHAISKQAHREVLENKADSGFGQRE